MRKWNWNGVTLDGRPESTVRCLVKADFRPRFKKEWTKVLIGVYSLYNGVNSFLEGPKHTFSLEMGGRGHTLQNPSQLLLNPFFSYLSSPGSARALYSTLFLLGFFLNSQWHSTASFLIIQISPPKSTFLVTNFPIFSSSNYVYFKNY